jgi:diaminopimelate epimerase
MSTRVAVTKMHAARNDFVVIDRRTMRVDSLPSFARWVCDRRLGVGADGVIVIETSAACGIGMRTFNADGSEAEMCGNGIRCAARWLDEAGEGDRITFETAAGEVRTEVIARDPEYLVRVDMPAPRIAARADAAFDGAYVVDVGNPHLVFLADEVDGVDLETLALRWQGSPRFGDGVNVHVAASEGRSRLRVRHWERGVGLTMACGTGAVAAVAAADAAGILDGRRLESPVEVVVPGGRLVVAWDGERAACLIGPAVRVFDTEVRVEH